MSIDEQKREIQVKFQIAKDQTLQEIINLTNRLQALQNEFAAQVAALDKPADNAEKPAEEAEPAS